MSKRHTPVFLTQKEYDELLENVEVGFEVPVQVSEFKPVGRVKHDPRKYKERDEKRSKGKEVL